MVTLVRTYRQDGNSYNLSKLSNTFFYDSYIISLSLSLPLQTERRILDFNECDTPSKGTENGRFSSSAISFPSPSSYLLKGFRQEINCPIPLVFCIFPSPSSYLLRVYKYIYMCARVYFTFFPFCFPISILFFNSSVLNCMNFLFS